MPRHMFDFTITIACLLHMAASGFPALQLKLSIITRHHILNRPMFINGQICYPRGPSTYLYTQRKPHYENPTLFGLTLSDDLTSISNTPDQVQILQQWAPPMSLSNTTLIKLPHTFKPTLSRDSIGNKTNPDWHQLSWFQGLCQIVVISTKFKL